MAKYKKKHTPTRSNNQPVAIVRTRTTNIKLQTKSQEYSHLVFTTINNLINANHDSSTIKRYKSLCKRSGGLLRTVGLIQFLTFLAAKATKETEGHYQYLLDQLTLELQAIKVLDAQDGYDLLANIRQQNLPDYMNTTTQVLQLLQWHKRIADILITGDD
jgi:CRISPR type III-B/RAMP module-associated protein Cmr5